MKANINKKIIYLFLIYHLFTPIYYIYIISQPDQDLALNGARFSAFGGMTLNTLFFGLIFLNLLPAFYKKSISHIINSFPIVKHFYYYMLLVLFLSILQYLFLGVPFDLIIRKPQNLLSMPVLLLNLFAYFQYSDIRRLKQFLYLSFIVTFLFFFIFSFLPYIMSIRGINYNFRVNNLLYYGPNGTAAFLAIFVPLLIFKKNIKSGMSKYFWQFLLLITFAAILLTYTRAIYFALIFVLVLSVLMSDKKYKFMIIFWSVSILFILAGNELYKVVLRGQTGIISNLADKKANTLAYRINMYWLPSIIFLFNHKVNLFIGTKFRGFNDFLVSTTGVNRANHNYFIYLFITYGISAMSYMAFIWLKILTNFSFIKTYKNIQIIKVIYYSLIFFFISSNFMNIDRPTITNIVTIMIFILYTINYKIKNAY